MMTIAPALSVMKSRRNGRPAKNLVYRRADQAKSSDRSVPDMLMPILEACRGTADKCCQSVGATDLLLRTADRSAGLILDFDCWATIDPSDLVSVFTG